VASKDQGNAQSTPWRASVKAHNINWKERRGRGEKSAGYGLLPFRSKALTTELLSQGRCMTIGLGLTHGEAKRETGKKKVTVIKGEKGDGGDGRKGEPSERGGCCGEK